MSVETILFALVAMLVAIGLIALAWQRRRAKRQGRERALGSGRARE